MPQPGDQSPSVDGVEQVRVARIGKPHGIRGEVTVQVYTDEPAERFVPGAVLTGRRGSGGRDGELTVVRARWNKDILLLAIEGITTRNQAEELRGTELFAAPDEAGEDDAWYEEDLVGLAVLVDGRRIGTVTGLHTGEFQDLLEIEVDGGAEVLVPFVDEIVPEIDPESGTVTLTPPPGLLTLHEDAGAAPEPGEPA
ncbi:ribosome maturation factor RimM [Citricoccus sp. I39-566]|uniref:ribosome maturation factor RimM n=1 Tax=Citricoccus sp. I39-566 TaxID=3073268 RepID=UPI00286B11FC|nr:ribosome maturation factor RimM [Citricoccus sp. I39-566]WMY77092.1 ribosome maturation factor RimM [Citricoccus sp. I39-566]